MGKDRAVAQRCQRRIGRNIAIGIDAGGLDLAIPDIAIDVTGKQRIEQQHIGPQTDRNAKDQPERARGRSTLGLGCRGDGQQTRRDGQCHERIIAETFEGKGSRERQADDDGADRGQ